MKEITRIHIAKIPYDVEISAKKDLEVYIKQLESFADGEDWVEDIEIRITELLLERGIDKNGLITDSDVEAVKSQLGQPEDFSQDDSKTTSNDDESNKETPTRRHLYRDLDRAVLGGVLSGIGKLTGVNPIWIRLIFIVLLLGSFGTVTIVYLVLWLAIPAAKTSAEKLQQEGKSVTLSSMKQLHTETESNTTTNKTASTVQSVLIYGLGTLFAIAAIISLLTTVVAALLIYTPLIRPDDPVVQSLALYATWKAWLTLLLFIASGLLLATLFSLIAAALFKRKLTRGMTTALIAITLSGITTFGIGSTSMVFGIYKNDALVAYSDHVYNHQLPDGFDTITNLVVKSGSDRSGAINSYETEYIVSDEGVRYEITAVVNNSYTAPDIEISEDGHTATIDLPNDESSGIHNMFYHQERPLIRIYGPELSSIRTKEAFSFRYINDKPQDNLDLETVGGQLSLKGQFTNVNSEARESASINLSESAIKNLTTNISEGYVSTGVIQNLNISHSTVCPAGSYAHTSGIDIESITSGQMTVNGQEMAAKDIEGSCFEIDIDSDHSEEDERED